MNLRHPFKLWSAPQQAPSGNSISQNIQDDIDCSHRPDMLVDNLAQVIQLQPGSPLDSPVGLNCQSQPFQPAPTRPRGLLDTPALQEFFAENHLGLGRHNGAQYKTAAAFELGRRNLISRFQNTLDLLISQKQAKIDLLQDMALQTKGVCQTVTSQLTLACQRIERDISVLLEQSELASDGKGWILRALNEYEIGFGKGLREAVDMELLG